MTDGVVLVRIEEHHLIRFRDRGMASHVTHENPAIGKDQVRLAGRFFCAFMLAQARTHHVMNRNGVGDQQG
jgi:hypothetical protein